MNFFEQEFAKADDFTKLFDLVKLCVNEVLGRSRAGIMLGLSPLGTSPQGFIGAYHQLGSNLIVLNESLLQRIGRQRPELLKHHVFHLLLHEYVHSLGIVDEQSTRLLTEAVTEKVFGPEHILSMVAKNFEKYLPDLRHAPADFQPPEQAHITLLDSFGQEDVGYIG
ncbi:MAG: hypothetical protein HY519_02235 [Candidatus Aenigmarchaeota archaeon]|nr:hypothetical protein [Candidatus Aenigmarchaeota archaeon]